MILSIGGRRCRLFIPFTTNCYNNRSDYASSRYIGTALIGCRRASLRDCSSSPRQLSLVCIEYKYPSFRNTYKHRQRNRKTDSGRVGGGEVVENENLEKTGGE